MSIIVKAHAVSATRIVQVQPLRVGGQIAGPDAGLLLVLSDNTKHKWLLEPSAPVPQVGDWLIVDPTMHTAYVVMAVQFAELFTVVNE